MAGQFLTLKQGLEAVAISHDERTGQVTGFGIGDPAAWNTLVDACGGSQDPSTLGANMAWSLDAMGVKGPHAVRSLLLESGYTEGTPWFDPLKIALAEIAAHEVHHTIRDAQDDRRARLASPIREWLRGILPKLSGRSNA